MSSGSRGIAASQGTYIYEVGDSPTTAADVAKDYVAKYPGAKVSVDDVIASIAARHFQTNRLLPRGAKIALPAPAALLSVPVTPHAAQPPAPSRAGAATATARAAAPSSKAADVDVSKLVRYVTERARASSTGKCARYVREGLMHAGLKISTWPRKALGYLQALEKWGFAKLSPQEASHPRVGDIAVSGYDGECGHIAVWNGHSWVSDFVHRTASAGIGPVRAVFRA